MEPGPDQGAKATWPHEQMTVENIVSIGDTWFEQLRTLMNTYLSGSAVHVFGRRSGIATSQQPFGPYHRRDQFKSPVAYATSVVRNEVLSHSDPDISGMDSRDFSFDRPNYCNRPYEHWKTSRRLLRAGWSMSQMTTRRRTP